MFQFLKKLFILLLASIANASNHAKCVFSSTRKGMAQPTLINLHPNVGSRNTFNYLSNTVCVPNKTENLNLSIFNMTTRIN